MKNFTLSILLTVVFGLAGQSQANYQTDSVMMGASYAYDVYYSMSQQGMVSASLRNNWDIAFRAYPTSASVLVNDGAGGMLWAYPSGAYSAWATVDTAGIGAWTPLYNSDLDWEEGAFNRHETGHPDYGWGVYNSVSHNVVGDSIFIMKTVNGPYKKVALLNKQSLAMIYTFRIANLDGTGDTTITLDAAPYSTKNFVYFDASANTILDREPVSADWDLVFSRYYAELTPDVFYPVVGVLQNYGVTAAKYAMADTSSMYWDFPDFMTERSTIGHTWKAINMTTFQWDIDDSLYFVVKAKNGDLYKLVFNSFTGTGTGKARFRKAKISGAGIADINTTELKVFPVPSSGELNIEIPEGMTSVKAQVFDLRGRMLMEQELLNNGIGLIDISALSQGVYMLRISNREESHTARFIRY